MLSRPSRCADNGEAVWYGRVAFFATKRILRIPAGGLFSGAEVHKTAEQVAIYGGIAGEQYDPCYHELCDNLSTLMTGVPPITAGGLGGFPDDAIEPMQRLGMV